MTKPKMREELRPFITRLDAALTHYKAIKRDHKAVAAAYRAGLVEKAFYLSARQFVTDAGEAIDAATVAMVEASHTHRKAGVTKHAARQQQRRCSDAEFH